MAGRWRNSGLILVGVAALALVAGASAASPDVAKMNLQAFDVPGGKIILQRSVTEKGYTAAYLRSFRFSVPSGSSRLVGVEAETKLAPTASVATAELSLVQRTFGSTAARKILIATIAKDAKVKLTAVVIGKLRKTAGYDQGFMVPISFPVQGKRVYENFVYLRLDRVAVFLLEVGLRPITPGATGKYVTALAGHIGTELAPIAVSPPTVSGNALQGQTLTATSGTWTAADTTFTYQWQRCDGAGANCVAVAGATASTYAVTPADVGATLNVVVTAANRFGAPAATSAATPVVA
jgi:hypothetical protein